LCSAVAHDGGFDARLAGAIDSARRVDALDGEVGGAPFRNRMRDQPDAAAQAEVGEVGRQRGLLHVGEQVRLDGHAGGLRNGAQRAGKLGVGTARVGGLDQLDGGG